MGALEQGRAISIGRVHSEDGGAQPCPQQLWAAAGRVTSSNLTPAADSVKSTPLSAPGSGGGDSFIHGGNCGKRAANGCGPAGGRSVGSGCRSISWSMEQEALERPFDAVHAPRPISRLLKGRNRQKTFTPADSAMGLPAAD